MAAIFGIHNGVFESESQTEMPINTEKSAVVIFKSCYRKVHKQKLFIAVLYPFIVPPLDLSRVVIWRSWTGELDSLTVQRGVSVQVAEILKQLQQLIGSVLKDGQHLGRHHVVHNKERRLPQKEEVFFSEIWGSINGEIFTAILRSEKNKTAIKHSCVRLENIYIFQCTDIWFN